MHRRLVVLGALGAAIAVPGCAQETRVTASQTVSVAVSEYRIRPNDIAAPSGVVTLLVHNYGRISHNLAVTDAHGTVAATRPIPPGESATLAVTLSAGTYTLASTLLSDQALGAYGTLVIH